jgi:hypothetical protein
MSFTQNLSYAIVQVAHNFGAAAVVGGSLAATLLKKTVTRKKLGWLVLAGWGTQAASGAAFGAVSYYFYHRFPDIAGIAVDALAVKMVCVSIGIVLLTAYLFRGSRWQENKQDAVWFVSSALAVVALSSAAVLRWFS